MREDSVCKLLENSCDLSDDDEEIELLVEEGQIPIMIRNKKSVKSSRDNDFFNNSSKHFTLSEEEDCESLTSQRDSFPLGAGCLPCTPKASKKSSNHSSSKQFCKHGHSSNSSNWCCGVVANTVKKTTKKL